MPTAPAAPTARRCWSVSLSLNHLSLNHLSLVLLSLSTILLCRTRVRHRCLAWTRPAPG
jgi:hypothetical protein